MLKAQLYKHPLRSDSSFYFGNQLCDYFDRPWHFHKEFELVYINKSYGTKFIGNKVLPFEPGDLTLIGSNLPHLFRNNEEFYQSVRQNRANSLFIHFTKDFLGDGFFELPEWNLVNRMLEKSAFGIQIVGKSRDIISQKLKNMDLQNPTQRLMSLLEILIEISVSSEASTILSAGFAPNNSGDTDKINKVFEYIIKNYQKEIYLDDISSQLHMSTAAFSRYFKKHTRKTFSDYVTEIRIAHACKLIIEDNKSVSEIGYLSGFENMANFYRHFKANMGMIPKDYKNKFKIS